MAHALRPGDVGSPREDHEVRARRDAAIARLDAVLARGGDDAVHLVTVLEVIAGDVDAVAARRAGLPPGERSAWEQVGARFDDWEAVARTRARTAEAFSELVRTSVEGDPEVAELLGVDRSRISQRVAQRSLYSFIGPSGRRLYPSWQFLDGEVLHGLKSVLESLPGGLHPLVVDRWATAPDPDLELDGVPMSPVDWLATGGDADRVVALAQELDAVP